MTISRAWRTGRNIDAVFNQSGNTTGGRNSPPPNARRNITTCVTAMAAFGPHAVPTMTPISIDGIAVTTASAVAERRLSGSVVADVNSAKVLRVN